MDNRTRRIAFAILVLVCVGIAAVAVTAGLRGDDVGGKAAPGAEKLLPDAQAKRQPVLLYRDTDGVRAGAAAAVEIAPAADPNAGKRTGLSCNRVYYAAGHGICLVRGGGFAAGFQARIFGPDLKTGKAVDVQGIPSRARVSPDGHYGSVTLFVAGDSYAAAGAFSTRTTLIDMARGTSLGDLEKFTTYDADQHQVTAQDANYWGVTFSPKDSDRFYATLATGGKTHLIEGSVTQRTAQVIHDNVECPSLSSDGTRIAYKQRTGDKDRPWRLTVLDLASERETHLAETRSVDDQAEWLDDQHVVYNVDGAVWKVPADGTGAPARLVDHADSPSVVRG